MTDISSTEEIQRVVRLYNDRDWVRVLLDKTSDELKPIVSDILDDLVVTDLVPIQIAVDKTESGEPKVFYLRCAFSNAEDGMTAVGINLLMDTPNTHTMKLDASLSPSIPSNQELRSTLITESAEMISNEWLNMLLDVAEPIESSVSFDNSLTEDKERAKVLVQINSAVNDIARVTNRGCGNWIVVNPKMMSALQLYTTESEPTVEPTTEIPQWFKSIVHVGTLQNTIGIYCSNIIPENQILVGYTGQIRGAKLETDGGIVVIFDEFTKDNDGKLSLEWGSLIDDKSKYYYRKIILA